MSLGRTTRRGRVLLLGGGVDPVEEAHGGASFWAARSRAIRPGADRRPSVSWPNGQASPSKAGAGSGPVVIF